MNVSTNIDAITQSGLMKGVMDTVSSTNAFQSMVLSNPKKWVGKTLDKSVKVTADTTGTSFAGLDLLPTGKANTKVRLSFDARAFAQPIVIDGMERDLAAGDPDAAVEVVANAIDEAAVDMSQAVGSILYGDGTGNSSKDFLGLKAIVDDGTVASTYGGQSRTTYTTLRSSRTAIGGTLTAPAQISAAIRAVEKYDNAKGNKVIFTTRALWTILSGLATPVQNTSAANTMGWDKLTKNGELLKASPGLKAEFGFNSVYVDGVPVVADEKCPATYMYILSIDYIGWYGLQNMKEGYKSIDFNGEKTMEGLTNQASKIKSGAIYRPFVEPTNQYGEISHILLRGNLVSFNPNRHAVIIFA
jgi:hypothetical protein